MNSKPGRRGEEADRNSSASTTKSQQLVGCSLLGVIMELGRCPTRASLVITTVSGKSGSWTSVVFVQSRKLQALVMLHQPQHDSCSHETWRHEFRRSPTLHTYTEVMVLAEGELTAGDVLGTTGLQITRREKKWKVHVACKGSHRECFMWHCTQGRAQKWSRIMYMYQKWEHFHLQWAEQENGSSQYYTLSNLQNPFKKTSAELQNNRYYGVY